MYSSTGNGSLAFKNNIQNFENRSSCYDKMGSAASLEHWVAGLIPRVAQWVKDLALPQAAAAQIWTLVWEPHMPQGSQKREGKKNWKLLLWRIKPKLLFLAWAWPPPALPLAHLCMWALMAVLSKMVFHSATPMPPIFKAQLLSCPCLVMPCPLSYFQPQNICYLCWMICN